MVFIFGPWVGLVSGLVEVSVALGIWIVLGQPDFYFRGWVGVQVHAILNCILGTVFGAVFGLALAVIELGWNMTIRTRFVVRAATIAALVIFGASNTLSFVNRRLYPEWPELALLAACGISIAVASAKPCEE